MGRHAIRLNDGQGPNAVGFVGVLTENARDGRRRVRSALIATARQVSPRRTVAIFAALVILVALIVFVPMPTAVELRDWATSAGPWFALAFLAAHVVITVFPFPRTAFTLAAGLLFGTALGVVLAVLASTVSALIALWLVRAVGWRLDRLARHPAVGAADERLQRRDWPVVLSLRLIPAVPFSVINYAAGMSAVRWLPYTVATLAGLIPGTLAVVVLGDAFTGHISPWLIAVSAATGGLGLVGLFFEYRAHRREHASEDSSAAPVSV